MKSEEVSLELQTSYDDLVEYLLAKYGPAQYDYFANESCRSKNPKVSRTKEGLLCHHIDEDKAIKLSNPRYAKKNPFEYQRASRLVYCNILEHLILHIKIIEKPKHKDANQLEVQGIGGVLAFICPGINDYYDGYAFKREYERTIYSVIEDNEEDYIVVLKYLLDMMEKKHPELYPFVSKNIVSRGGDGRIVEEIFIKL